MYSAVCMYSTKIPAFSVLVLVTLIHRCLFLGALNRLTIARVRTLSGVISSCYIFFDKLINESNGEQYTNREHFRLFLFWYTLSKMSHCTNNWQRTTDMLSWTAYPLHVVQKPLLSHSHLFWDCIHSTATKEHDNITLDQTSKPKLPYHGNLLSKRNGVKHWHTQLLLEHRSLYYCQAGNIVSLFSVTASSVAS